MPVSFLFASSLESVLSAIILVKVELPSWQPQGSNFTALIQPWNGGALFCRFVDDDAHHQKESLAIFERF